MTRRSRAPLPRYMSEKRLTRGGLSYFWAPPTWARKNGCPVHAEALGTDYLKAHERAALLNAQLDGWRTGRHKPAGPVKGTLAWLVAEYRKLDAYKDQSERSRGDADHALRRFTDFPTKRGPLGMVPLVDIIPELGQRIYSVLVTREDGTERRTTANREFRIARAAWNAVRRHFRSDVPERNPFADLVMKRPKGEGGAKPATRAQLEAFVRASDACCLPAMGTAALIAFELLLREIDIFERLTWADWRPEAEPDCVIIHHGKTERRYAVRPYPLPLFDLDGAALHPEMLKRVENTTRRALLIIMPDQKRRGVDKPYTLDRMYDHFDVIRERAGLPKWITFASFRKGGMTELGKSGFTDREMLGLSGHKTVQMLSVYSKADVELRRQSARKRLAARTKRGALSE